VSERWLAPAAAIVALAVLVGLSVFVVDEDEFAVRTRFGQVQQADYAAGLHGCWPFERIERVDRRVLTQHLQAEPFLDVAQLGLLVDIDLSWRVSDPVVFLRSGAAASTGAGATASLSASAETAVAMHLAEALRSKLKAVYAQRSLAQLLATPRGGITDELLAGLAPLAASLGVQVIDARVRRIDPTEQMANAIYARMQEAYAVQARALRAEGTAAADKIRAGADRDAADIAAAANRDAQRLRGEGDAQAAATLARAYGANPEFAAFYRSLQAYRNALGRDSDILVIHPDGEFYKYLHAPARP